MTRLDVRHPLCCGEDNPGLSIQLVDIADYVIWKNSRVIKIDRYELNRSSKGSVF